MKSPIKWMGGKRKEIKHFKKYIPNFDTYVEPFLGGGALYWELKPKKAHLNDINEYLINFYLQLKQNYRNIIEKMFDYVNTKEEFKKQVVRLNNKEYEDEIDKARLFYYLNRTARSGMWRVNSKGEFNTSYGKYKTDTYKTLDETYSKIIQSASITNHDFKEVLDEHKEDDNAFIFLDPPYLNCDTMYTESQQFKGIYDYIRNYMNEAKCKVMLVVKKDEYITELFKEYIVDTYNVMYKNNASEIVEAEHLVICNYFKTK
jgi:DNA adenine methylase